MLNIFFPFVGLGDLNRKEQKIMAWYQKYSHVSLPVLKALFFFQAEDGIRDPLVTGVQTCALPISLHDGATMADPAAIQGTGQGEEIGRASCRERGEIAVVAVSLKKKCETAVD